MPGATWRRPADRIELRAAWAVPGTGDTNIAKPRGDAAEDLLCRIGRLPLE
ncbi:MAG: hypothetical protein QOG89_917 [Thermomicrobiales bacterium]|nr:hypothetical protein [Thermomicrobiales bacterium]